MNLKQKMIVKGYKVKDGMLSTTDSSYIQQSAKELDKYAAVERPFYEDMEDSLRSRGFVLNDELHLYENDSDWREYWTPVGTDGSEGLIVWGGSDSKHNSVVNSVWYANKSDFTAWKNKKQEDEYWYHRVKDDKIEPFYYNFGESGRYDEDYEMYDEDHDVADYLMNEADLLESKYSVYENGGDTVENWEQCIHGYFDLVDKTNVTDVDAVFHILEDANFHLLNWVLLLEKGTDKDVQYAIDFIFDDTDGFIQRNQRYIALRNVINEMGIA